MDLEPFKEEVRKDLKRGRPWTLIEATLISLGLFYVLLETIAAWL